MERTTKKVHIATIPAPEALISMEGVSWALLRALLMHGSKTFDEGVTVAEFIASSTRADMFHHPTLRALYVAYYAGTEPHLKDTERAKVKRLLEYPHMMGPKEISPRWAEAGVGDGYGYREEINELVCYLILTNTKGCISRMEAQGNGNMYHTELLDMRDLEADYIQRIDKSASIFPFYFQHLLHHINQETC